MVAVSSGHLLRGLATTTAHRRQRMADSLNISPRCDNSREAGRAPRGNSALVTGEVSGLPPPVPRPGQAVEMEAPPAAARSIEHGPDRGDHYKMTPRSRSPSGDWQLTRTRGRDFGPISTNWPSSSAVLQLRQVQPP
jgi:hypothetical protein